MSLSLKSYFKFDYRKFLGPLITHGTYKLETLDENDQPILSTQFYLDGDVINEVFTDEHGYILAESNADKVKEHLDQLEEKVGSMDVLYTQIQGIVVLITTIISFIFASSKAGPGAGAAITAGVGTALVLLRKYWFKGIVWIISNLVVPLVQARTRKKES